MYGVGPDNAAHVAQVFSQDVNVRQPNGTWTDVRNTLHPEPGYGWQATVWDVTTHFPTSLSLGTPVRLELPGGAVLKVVPENVDS